jgi:GTP-binding protein
MKPVVAIVGRPNVGKSTLFNRMTRSRQALVDDFPGVTRDRHFGEAVWDDTLFTVVDTGGFAMGDQDRFAEQVRRQVHQAIAEADVVVMLLDGKSGLSPYDDEMIALLRRLAKLALYVVNKIDDARSEANLLEFHALGIDLLHPVSAEHGYGMHDFMDFLVAELPKTAETASPDEIRVAVVGRPNVGKSSLINRIVGQERLVVSEQPGTTRDAIDTLCLARGKRYRLVDTAGIRRKRRVNEKLEKFSIIKALKSLDRCHIALIVIDATQGVTEQDIRIAGYAYERGCGAVFVVNKWDLMAKAGHNAGRFQANLKESAKFLSFAPTITVSALTGLRIGKIFGLIDAVQAQFTQRVGTGQINKMISRAVARTEPPLHKGRRLKFYYATQVSTGPPTFVCFVNFPAAVHFSYRRYLINQIRDAASLDLTPLRVIFRQRTSKEMPFLKKQRQRQSKCRRQC